MTTSIDLQQRIADCTNASPQTILKQAFAAFGDDEAFVEERFDS